MKMRPSRLIFIQLALLLSTTMYAQQDSTSVLKGMTWRNIGPNLMGASGC